MSQQRSSILLSAFKDELYGHADQQEPHDA
jgi:hypothetical protein